MQITNRLATIAEFETSSNPEIISSIDSSENLGFEFRQLSNNDYSLKSRFQFFWISQDKSLTVIIDGDSIVDFDMNNEAIYKDHFWILYITSIEIFQQEFEKEKIKKGIELESNFFELDGLAKDKIIEQLSSAWDKIDK